MTPTSDDPTTAAAAPELSARTRIGFGLLRLAAAVLALGLPVLAVVYWLFDVSAVLQDSTLRAIAVVTALMHLLPLSWGLYRLRACLAAFAEGQPFDARAIAGLRDFAVGTGLSALIKPIAGAILSLAMSWNTPSRQISLQISSDTMVLALFAGVIASLAWALHKAACLAEENSQFI